MSGLKKIPKFYSFLADSIERAYRMGYEDGRFNHPVQGYSDVEVAMIDDWLIDNDITVIETEIEDRSQTGCVRRG